MMSVPTTTAPLLFFEEVPQPDFIKARMSEKESTNLALWAGFLARLPKLRKRDARLAARMVYEVMERLIHRYMSNFECELDEDVFIAETADMLYRYLFDDGP